MGRRLVGAITVLLVVPLLAAGTAEARSRDRRGDDRRFERRGRVEFRSRDNRLDRSSRSYYTRRYDDGRRDSGFRDRRRGDFDRHWNSDGDRYRVDRYRDVVIVDRHRDRRYVRQYPVYVTPQPVYFAPRPVYVRPRPVVYVPSPVVIYPHPATIVTGPQLIVTGRAPIGSRVMVEVTAIFGGRSVVYPTYDSYADYHGGFRVPVHTTYPGAEHRVKVWSVVDGAYSAPAGVIVYRR